jgi:hypothetical protein
VKENVKEKEKARERAREKVKEVVEREKAREKVTEGLVGVSFLRHREGDGVHYGLYQVLPDGVGVPYTGKELIEQGDLFIRGSVCRQEFLEVDLDGFDLGWVVGPRGRVLRWGLVLHRDVVGRGGFRRWQAFQPPPVLVGEVHRLVDVNLIEALPPGASPTTSAHAALFPNPASVTTGTVGRPISTQNHDSPKPRQTSVEK